MDGYYNQHGSRVFFQQQRHLSASQCPGRGRGGGRYLSALPAPNTSWRDSRSTSKESFRSSKPAFSSLSIAILSGEDAVRAKVDTCFLRVHMDWVDANVPCEDTDEKELFLCNFGTGDDGADVCQLAMPAKKPDSMLASKIRREQSIHKRREHHKNREKDEFR